MDTDAGVGDMSRRRALLTDSERLRISGEEDVEDHKRYQAAARVRRKITEELPEDVEILRENHPELYEELLAAVCPEHHRESQD